MKVLLGIGGTEDSFRALREIVERTANAGDDLTVAVLENPRTEVTPGEIDERVHEVVENAGLAVGDGQQVAIRHVEGDPGSRLVDIAESEGYDEIVLGGGERSPMGKIQIGPIAEFVLLNSHTTVTLVR